MAVFLDTNILLYSISDLPHEQNKRQISEKIIDSGGIVLSVQVLQEFYVQATRVTRPAPLSHEDAAGLVCAWMRFQIEPMTAELVERALEIRAMHKINYWDATIVAAAEAAGVSTLFTEDLNHKQKIGAVDVRNPYLPT